jgi:glycosyl transferase family 92
MTAADTMPGAPGSRAYLALCSMYKDHAEYLREWIEFHRLVGVERFFLYDNESTDDHEQVLAPYLERGIVEVHHWPTPPSVERGVPWGIIDAFNDCIERHRDDARWIAFIDTDEFLFSPTGRSLPDVLSGFEQFAGVEVSRLDFGPSGHKQKPPGLVTENYLRRRNYVEPKKDWEHVKSIVDPARTTGAFNAHGFYYSESWAVRETGERGLEDPPGRRGFPHVSQLRINHYITKSHEEYARKSEQWKTAGMPWPEDDPSPFFEWLSTQPDDTITVYLPSLREALARPVG